jgi:anthranilate synthase component 2
MPSLLVLDNYDSFTFNLVQMFRHYDLQIHVKRSDRLTLKDVYALSPDYILISPGPKDPQQAGLSIDVIKAVGLDIPTLGVCLGMQCLNEAFGGQTIKAPLPLHGKVSRITHQQTGIFQGLPSPLIAARYHSLMCHINGTPLMVSAYSEDGVIMGLHHPHRPLHGVQFHPESFLTEFGFRMVENFLKLGALGTDVDPCAFAHARLEA